MISELLKRIMVECNLKQADLVGVLGVSLSRVKAMTSGRVKNLTREENEALIGKLGIRATWLVTGEGPMRDSGEGESHPAKQTPTGGVLDIELLTEAIAAVEKLVAHRGRTLPPAKKAQVIAQIYETLVSGQNGTAVAQMLAKAG